MGGGGGGRERVVVIGERGRGGGYHLHCPFYDAHVLLLAYLEDNIGCHFVASVLSGFVTAVVSMPADIAKTRYGDIMVAITCALHYYS